ASLNGFAALMPERRQARELFAGVARGRGQRARAGMVLARDQAHGESFLRSLRRTAARADKGAGHLLMGLHVGELAERRLQGLERRVMTLPAAMRRAARIKRGEELIGVA